MLRLSSRNAFSGMRMCMSKRNGSTLAFVETAGDSITSASLSTINAAKQLGNPIVAVLLGSNSSKIAQEQVSKIAGLSKVLVSDDSKLDHYLPELVSPIFKNLISNDEFSHLIVPASTVGKNVLPRVGALLDVQPISDIIKIEDSTTFKRPIYAGNAIVTVKSKDSKVLISARPSAFDAQVENSENSYTIENIDQPIESTTIEWVSENLTKSERPELSSAKIVVSGGRGLKNKENFSELIYPLADNLKAGVGATRAAVDSGFVDNSLQVGQTGKVIAPELYIAVGISGAIQHLAGMKDSKTIVAINKDEEAPIFNVSDYGLVGDLFEIVPELTEKTK